MELTDEYRRGLLENDRPVLNKLYGELFPKVRAMCQPNLDTDETWEVLQSGIVLVYQRLASGNLDLQQPVINYIYGVCRNLIRKKISNNSSGRVTLLGDEVPNIEDEDALQYELVNLERQRLYQEKLMLLGERCQQLIALYLQKMALTKIKERMGYASEDAVKQQKFKCKKQLIDYCRKDLRFKSLI